MKEIQATFPIQGITVYPQRARIIRKADIALAKGDNKLTIKDLPATLTQDSIRVEIPGQTKLKIIDVYSEDLVIDAYDENFYRKTKQSLDDLLYKRQKLEAAFKNYNQEFLLFLEKESLISTAKEDKHRPINVNNWDEFFTFLREKLDHNRQALRSIIFSWLDIQRKIEAAEQNLAKYESYDKIKEHRVNIIIQAAAGKSQAVKLAYLQPNVSWYPAYTLRADLDRNVMAVYVYAMIKQNTGEDWQDVDILLSTAIPLQNCDIPEIESKKLKQRDTEILIQGIVSKEEEAKEAVFDGVDDLGDMMMGGMMNNRADKKKIVMEKAKSKKGFFKGGGRARAESMRAPKKKMEKREEIATEAPAEEPAPVTTIMKPGATLASTISTEDISTGKQLAGGTELIKNLLGTVDNRILPSFSLNILSDYYRELYNLAHDDYTPESIIPAKPAIRFNKFFTKGISPLNSLGGYDYRYQVPSKENSIPSVDMPVQIGVDIKELPIELTYITIPVEKEAVFLRSRFKNDGENPLPAGPAQVFVENSFLGNINFPTLGLNQPTDVSLGIERDIKVIRKENGKRRTKGIIGKDAITDYTVEIELISYKKQPVEIEILDRIPNTMKKKKEISIIDISFEPKPHIKSDRNILVWKKKLQPNKKLVIKFFYSIRHPENFRLTMSRSSHPYQEGKE